MFICVQFQNKVLKVILVVKLIVIFLYFLFFKIPFALKCILKITNIKQFTEKKFTIELSWMIVKIFYDWPSNKLNLQLYWKVYFQVKEVFVTYIYTVSKHSLCFQYLSRLSFILVILNTDITLTAVFETSPVIKCRFYEVDYSGLLIYTKKIYSKKLWIKLCLNRCF